MCVKFGVNWSRCIKYANDELRDVYYLRCKHLNGDWLAMGFGAKNNRGWKTGGRAGGRSGGMGKRMIVRLILVAIIAGGSYAAQKGWLGKFGDIFMGEKDRQVESGSRYQKDFEKLEGVRLVSAKGNDGDSFLVEHEGKTYHFRLYYVDAPEKYKSDRNSKRVREQADYFGIDSYDAVGIGKSAKKSVEKWLKENEFTVHTKWEGVYGNDRYYGFVELEEDNERVFLCEKLIEDGLARLHTKGVDTPNGVLFRDFRDYLRKEERNAKREKVGAWGK